MTESARAITELGILVVIASVFLGGTVYLFRKYFKKQDEQNQIKEKWITSLQDRLDGESKMNREQTVHFVQSIETFRESFEELCRQHEDIVKHQDFARDKAISIVDKKWVQISEEINTRMMERLAVLMGERDNNLQKTIQKVDLAIGSNTEAIQNLRMSMDEILKEVKQWQE